ARDARLAHAIMARARATLDVPLRALLSFAAGMINEVAGRISDADAAYNFALVADSDLLPVLDAARRLRLQAGNWGPAATLTERAANASLSLENAAQAWLEAGELYETKLNDPARALASYRALLAKQPAQTEALERALRLLELAGDFGTSASLL